MNKSKKVIILYFLIVIFILMLGIVQGSTSIPVVDTLTILLHKVFYLTLPNGIDAKDISIIWQLRLPRVLLAFMVGGALAASGSVVQSILKNQLASPYTLGISSGASLGAGMVIILGIYIPLLGRFTLPLVGFLFGIITVYVVLVFAARVDKSLSNNTIILAGMVFSLFVNGLLTTLTGLFSEDIKAITLWQMGSFAMKGWAYVLYMLPFCTLGMIGVLRYTKEMDLLTFGEEQARAIGVDTHKVKKRLFLYVSILTGASVALTGVIGFIDLIAPHIVRRFLGSKHIYVVPMSFIFGGTLMVLTDLLARTLIVQTELPVGAITALVGAPFFAYIYFENRK